MHEPRRSDVLRAAAGAGIALAGLPLRGAAQSLPKVSYGDLFSGVTGIISGNIAANRLDLKHGVDMSDLKPYTAVSTYYNDFAAGTFDAAMGSWDFFADMYQKGVPIKLVCTVTTADMINIIAAPPIASLSDVKGKTMSAVIGSGSFAMSRAIVREVAKLDLQKDVQMQNAPNPAGCIALLQSGSVVSALTWEPTISNAIAQNRALKPIFNVGSAYRDLTKNTLPYFSVAVRTDALKRAPDMAQRIAAIFGDCIDRINKAPLAAFHNVEQKTGLTAQVMATGYIQKRLVFASYNMNVPNGRKVISDAYTYLRGQGMFEKPLSPDFFA